MLNAQDHRHAEATALVKALETVPAEIIDFDCVVAESLSTVLRRLEEKRQTGEVQVLLLYLGTNLPAERITWVMPDVPRLYAQILSLLESSVGTLNFHDALIALACQERGIPAIASFDGDFDQIEWLRRLATRDDVTAAMV